MTVPLRQRSDCDNLPGVHIAQLSLQFSDMYLCFDKQSPENAHVLHLFGFMSLHKNAGDEIMMAVFYTRGRIIRLDELGQTFFVRLGIRL